MGQAFLPIVTVLDFTPAQPSPLVPTQAFSLVVTMQDVTQAKSPSFNTSIHTCGYYASARCQAQSKAS
ncbi:hypothetical protein PILCRDRAFT_812879 [Piloderma croceum F 1598]|uniref:Uncharacterized protein n=1 Tax=Piloderma croceum (strain F 1598) TaxID=765440 RepID=A0A0C3GED1_PILCF|nr:hypothetical protein PILCRDRAFT_812879 [Piloderma croceum F 1598]